MWHAACLALRLLAPQHPAVVLVRVLDVSDARIGGDAILITDSAGGRARHVLLDAGDRPARVLAALRRYDVDTLAALILSHPHADHYGGMPAVLAAVPVRAFVIGGTPHAAVTYSRLLAAVAARHIPVITVDSGVRTLTLVTAQDTTILTLIAPPPSCRTLASNAGDDVNDCSVGVRLTHGSFRMLLPGDAETAELAWWMDAHPVLLAADVLKAGHHGSDNATTAPWLDAVHPRAVIISANGRQHPFADVLRLLAMRHVPTYCTADDGTITVRAPRDSSWTIVPTRVAPCHPRTESH
jgi:competence protein ComEC